MSKRVLQTCDRCGKATYAKIVDGKVTLQGLKWVETNKGNENGIETKAVDLCENCYRLLEEFLFPKEDI